MKTVNMLILICLLVAHPLQAGVVRITFDPPTSSWPGSCVTIDEWVEKDVVFTSPNGLGHANGGGEWGPENGSAHLSLAVGETLVFRFTDWTAFELLTIDLAEYSIWDDQQEIVFVGHKTDDTTVTAEFMLDGVIDGIGPLADFETFSFGADFKDLKFVEVPSVIYSMDNVFLVPVPDLPTFMLLGLGTLILRNRRSSS